MKAMILAAGLGMRLRPLTDDRPKALVEIAGRTLLEICLARLRAFGIHEVIVNTHHFADRMLEYLEAHRNFGMRIELSREELLLDTGGGLKKAAWFFTETEEPFILHNVDVLSTIDLTRMVRFHGEHNALATLAVQDRRSSRSLLFDERGQLCGHRKEGAEKDELLQSVPAAQALAFSGVHVVSPRLFAKMREDGAFSIISAYVHLAARGEKIVGFRADDSYWRDLGRPESILQAARDLESGAYSETRPDTAIQL